MNHLLIGIGDKANRLLDFEIGYFLLIDDGPIGEAFLDKYPQAKLFDVNQHKLNPLTGMDYKRARDLATTIFSIDPSGQQTLTTRNGRRALAKMFMDKPKRLDKLPRSTDPAIAEANAAIDDLLLSPVLRQIFCGEVPNFSLKGSVVLKLDRSVLADYDAFVLACVFLGQFKGQVIVPDGGFYLRDFHLPLIRQERLIAGIDLLSDTTPRLAQGLLRIKDKTVFRTNRTDAETLMFYIDPKGNPAILTELDPGEYRIAG